MKLTIEHLAPTQQNNLNLCNMKKFQLSVRQECRFDDDILKHKGQPISFDFLYQAVDFVKTYKSAHKWYITQTEENEDNWITLSMQEVVDAFDSGESPEDLDWF